MLRAGVAGPAAVPEATQGVLPRVLGGLKGLVVLLRPVEAAQEVKGVPVRTGGHPEATDAAVGLGVPARLAALAAAEARLPAAEAVAGVPAVKLDEVPVQAAAGATPGTAAAVAVPVPRAGTLLIAAGGRQATAAAGPTTPVLPGA